MIDSPALGVSAIGQAVSRLEGWLETMRGTDGYGGPVVHWWRHGLQFSGAGLDWRYEGIIIGYLQLFEATGDERWLEKARRAGNDLVRGQTEAGNYRNSSFELNPYAGGTPHEAACDLALLRLADVLRAREEADAAERYASAAETNLRSFYIGRRWLPAGHFSDSDDGDSFVPNKAATLVEALLALAAYRVDPVLMGRYVMPTLDKIVEHQINSSSSVDGGIYQSSLDGRITQKFFPFYVARCLPALVTGWERTGRDVYLDAARKGAAFLGRWQMKDGAFPQVVYGNGSTSSYPRWYAAAADILRCADTVRPYGVVFDEAAALSRLMTSQLANGAFPAAEGFRSQFSQRTTGKRDFYDLLPVCGWNDKAFRFLTSRLEATKVLVQHDATEPRSVECECFLGTRAAIYREDESSMVLTIANSEAYRWDKGSDWAVINDFELMVK